MAAQENSTPREIEVTLEDLPLHCPPADVPQWSHHPRVFLDIAHSGEVRCPYCGAVYRLKAGTIIQHHG